MPRIQTLFASAAVGVLLLGLLTSRLKPGSELVVTFHRTGYGLPYSMLCYGVPLLLFVCSPLFGLDGAVERSGRKLAFWTQRSLGRSLLRCILCRRSF